jgi:hypothetical protein
VYGEGNKKRKCLFGERNKEINCCATEAVETTVITESDRVANILNSAIQERQRE